MTPAGFIVRPLQAWPWTLMAQPGRLVSAAEATLRLRPRSSADRATDFESVRGGSTPPGAIAP
jgi:hypothetical protein